MEKKEFDLEKLKEEYKEIQKKHALPEFELMNLDFGIEKISQTETDFLIREVTKVMAEKFSNYLRFAELLLNPVNAQVFIFSIIKTLGEEEKKRLSEIYKQLVKIEVRLIELDLEFSEEKEAKFIKETFEIWKRIKEDFLKIFEKVQLNWDNKFENNSKGYFG